MQQDRNESCAAETLPNALDALARMIPSLQNLSGASSVLEVPRLTRASAVAEASDARRMILPPTPPRVKRPKDGMQHQDATAVAAVGHA